ncbi:MAG: hypothetical protein H7249_02590 [Chitinophagaceae bacterium]|nr:hypothetical protein [Oligoflexus sp.]
MNVSSKLLGTLIANILKLSNVSRAQADDELLQSENAGAQDRTTASTPSAFFEVGETYILVS